MHSENYTFVYHLLVDNTASAHHHHPISKFHSPEEAVKRIKLQNNETVDLLCKHGCKKSVELKA